MTATAAHPLIIQGGMGVGVSGWPLARAVTLAGQLGVVSGSVLDTLFVRRLQDGDAEGHLRRALENFPMPEAVEDILSRYFRPEGRAQDEPYKPIPMYRQVVSRTREQLTIAANFCEVWLAKEGHAGRIGLNLLTKVQLPNLASLYGAMLAGVDYVLMGAGIPREIPGVLDRLARHEPASSTFDIEGADRSEKPTLSFDPRQFWHEPQEELRRPLFLPIIASNSLATMLAHKATGRVDGFVIEAPSAGGHNAPPRGAPVFDERGEPVYGERDVVDLEKIHELGLPFWVAGGAGSPEALEAALAAGAEGVQVGTLFAYCEESGLAGEYKQRVLEQAADEAIDVVTDVRASPTGFPFKVVQLEDTLSAKDVFEQRPRECDLGYLRTAYVDGRGRIGYRCPAEPVDTYVKKGGRIEDTEGRRCLCNALLADVGAAQLRNDGEVEKALITSGDDLLHISRFSAGRTRYSAGDVVEYLLSRLPERQPREMAATA